MEQQAKGIGAEAMAARAVSSETVFELFNAVLTLPAIVIEAKKRNTLLPY